VSVRRQVPTRSDITWFVGPPYFRSSACSCQVHMRWMRRASVATISFYKRPCCGIDRVCELRSTVAVRKGVPTHVVSCIAQNVLNGGRVDTHLSARMAWWSGPEARIRCRSALVGGPKPGPCGPGHLPALGPWHDVHLGTHAPAPEWRVCQTTIA